MPNLEPDPISTSPANAEFSQEQIDELAATDMTFREIEKKYGEEVAINVGIARDPDTFELDDEWFANARKWMADNPEIVQQIRNKESKFKWPAKEWAHLPIDFDLLDHFRKDGPDWHKRLNDTLRQAVFGAETPRG